MATDVLMTTTEDGDRRAWNITLWISQICLAWLLAMDGVVRLWLPMDALRERLPWVNPYTNDWVRFTGWALLCAAVALVLPPLLRLGEKLVPATAMAMALVMIITAAQHLIRGRPQMVAIDACIFAMCVLVAWGRTKRVPFEERTDDLAELE
jgi:putative oxidoreductase